METETKTKKGWKPMEFTTNKELQRFGEEATHVEIIDQIHYTAKNQKDLLDSVCNIARRRIQDLWEQMEPLKEVTHIKDWMAQLGGSPKKKPTSD